MTGICCTYCIDSPVPAVISCLMCEASLCDNHLRVHSKGAEHVLTEPSTNLENRKCSIHKEFLKYYCTEDDACICVSCSLAGEHRGHQLDMLDEASEKKKEKLTSVLQKLMTKREKIKKRVRSLEKRRKKAQEKVSGEANRVTALFIDIRRRLDDLEKRVLSEISRKEKVSLSLSDVIQKLEKEKRNLSRKIKHIEELCNMTDPLIVLQDPDTGDLCDPEKRGGDEDTGGHDGGDEDTGGHDGGDENPAGHDAVDEDTGGHNGGDEETGGHNGGDEDTEGHNGSDEDTRGHDGGDENPGGHDGGDKDTVGHDGGDEDTGRHDGGDEDTGVHDGGDEDQGGHDGVDEDTWGHDVGDEDTGGHDGGDEDQGGHDGGDRGVDGTVRTRGVEKKVAAAGEVELYGQDPVDILLDINTAHHNLLISNDLKVATWTETYQNRPETPERFRSFQVISRGSFSSGRHYWDVQISGSGLWSVGMCYLSIDRGNLPYTGGNKSWGLWGGQEVNNKYFVIHDSKKLQLPPQISSDRFRICLDYEAGELSFYELCDPIRHLHTFTTTFTEPLHAAFLVYEGSIKILGGAVAGTSGRT